MSIYNKVIRGNNKFIRGNDNYITGNANYITGNDSIIHGHNNRIIGNNNDCNGNANVIEGKNNIIHGINNVIYGDDNECKGNGNSLYGKNNTNTGINNINESKLSHSNLIVESVFNNYKGNQFHSNSNINYESNSIGGNNNTGIIINDEREIKKQKLTLLDRIPKDIKDEKTEIERDMCVICLENKKNIILSPCSHINTCFQCITTIIKEKKEESQCPTCRQIITKIKKCYI